MGTRKGHTTPEKTSYFFAKSGKGKGNGGMKDRLGSTPQGAGSTISEFLFRTSTSSMISDDDIDVTEGDASGSTMSMDRCVHSLGEPQNPYNISNIQFGVFHKLRAWGRFPFYCFSNQILIKCRHDHA